MRISLVEYGVMNCPEGMEHWRMYRIEYGGHAERCLVEGVVWLPEDFDPEAFERHLEAISVHTSDKINNHGESDK